MCGLTVAADGSEDHLIHCFKEGQPCQAGRDLLVRARGEAAEAFEEEHESDEEQEFKNKLVIEDEDDEREGGDGEGEGEEEEMGGEEEDEWH